MSKSDIVQEAITTVLFVTCLVGAAVYFIYIGCRWWDGYVF